MQGEKSDFLEQGSLKCSKGNSVPIFKVKQLSINEHQWGVKRRLTAVLHYPTDNTDTFFF